MDFKQVVLSNLTKKEYELHHSLSSIGLVGAKNRTRNLNKFGFDYIDYIDEDEKKTAQLVANTENIVKNNIFSIEDGDFGYTKDRFVNFDYQYNFYGFRDKLNREYSTNNQPNEIWCFGCSWTEGVGVPIEYTWPSFIENKTGCVVKNFGVAGSGIMTTHRLLSNWLKYSKYKPKKVFIFGWWRGRFEYRCSSEFGDDRIIMMNSATYTTLMNSSWLNSDMKKDIENSFMKTDKEYEQYKNSIESVLQTYKIDHKIIDIEIEGQMFHKVPKPIGRLDRGRDTLVVSNKYGFCEERKGHQGIITQNEVSDLFLKS